MAVSLIDARSSRRNRVLLCRMFPLYAHELSNYTPFFTIDERGRWNPELSRDWLVNPHVEPYLIHSDGMPAGFAIVGRHPFQYMSQDRDFKLCEFFILASHRRRGVGQAAAGQVFDRHRGRWELTILPDNQRAQIFWRSVLGPYTRGRLEEFQVPGDIVMRFSNG